MTISVLSTAQLAKENDIPLGYLCPLTSESIIEIKGEDTQNFLQGQLTADVSQLKQTQALRTCHCDAKGKTLHIGLIAQWQDTVLLIGNKASTSNSLAALKKFSVFSKITIEEPHLELRLFAGKGQAVSDWLVQVLGKTPTQKMECVQSEHGGAMLIDEDSHFLIWLLSNWTESALKQYGDTLVDESIWYTEQILAGIPSLTEQTVAQFVPQMLNLQAIEAISFSKGCYMGQETIARTKYLGKNKRATYLLKADAAVSARPNDRLQLLIGDHWKPTGNIINGTTLSNQTWLLAVLPNDLAVGDNLNYQDISFYIQPLPYSLT